MTVAALAATAQFSGSLFLLLSSLWEMTTVDALDQEIADADIGGVLKWQTVATTTAPAIASETEIYGG